MANKGFCLWLTGLPSSGKTTIARTLQPMLRERGWNTKLLDGDEVRRGLSADLWFDRAAREAHARRVALVAKVRAYNDAIPIVALTSPYTTSRAHARNEIGRFVEIHVSTLLEVGKPRDGKSLYKQARQREAREMTGVDDLHEDPERSDIRVDAVGRTPEETAGCVLAEFDCLG